MEDSAAFIPVWVMTGFWFFIGCVLPWMIPSGENRGVIQTMLITTAVCCYIFFLGTFLMQMNPIIGPVLDPKKYAIAAAGWGSPES